MTGFVVDCRCIMMEEALDEEEKDIEAEDVKPLEPSPRPCTTAVSEYYNFILPFVNKGTEAYRLGATGTVGQLLFHCQVTCPLRPPRMCTQL